jgi:hypothetical protein
MAKGHVETSASAPRLAEVAAEPPVESEDSSTSDESGPTPTNSSVNSKDDVPTTVIEDAGRKKMESLKDRGRIPNSFWVSVTLIVLLEGCSGMYKMETLRSWWSSFTTSIYTVRDLLQYEKDLMWSVVIGDLREPKEYLQATIVTILAGSILWVLVGKPMAAGVWTGQRASRHKLHRYMGLFFLTQYTLAWVEFITNYKGVGQFSFLPHTVALNGMLRFLKMLLSSRFVSRSVLTSASL